MEPWTVRRILDWTTKDLTGRGIDSARLDAEILLAHALGIDRLGLFLDLDRPLDELERADYRELVVRRRHREPVAYVTGTKEFWSLAFAVDEATLVPRPDTEVLVEEVLELLPGDGQGVRLVDVGSGSGCIGLALATERPALQVIAIEIDARAVAMTARNAAALDVSDRVTVVRGDLLGPLRGPVDVVVSNLPYIPSRVLDDLEPEVARWEPRRALDGGADGLDLFRSLLDQARAVIAPGGALVLEVGHDEQARQVASLLDEQWEVVKVRRDYGGVERVVVANLHDHEASAATGP